MAEALAACNAAYDEFKKMYPDCANYFEFLYAFQAGLEFQSESPSTN